MMNSVEQNGALRTATGLRYVAFTVTGPASNRMEVRVGVIKTAVWFAMFIPV